MCFENSTKTNSKSYLLECIAVVSTAYSYAMALNVWGLKISLSLKISLYYRFVLVIYEVRRCYTIRSFEPATHRYYPHIAVLVETVWHLIYMN